MNRFLDRNNGFFMTLERMANFCILNVLTLVCCLPIITAGASITAGNRVMQSMLTDGEVHIVKSFFEVFWGNFGQSTLLGILSLLVIGFLGFDFLIVGYFSSGVAYIQLHPYASIAMYVILGIITLICVGTAAYAFAMVGRYEETLGGHLRNAFFLVFHKLPRTIFIVAICLSPVWFAMISLYWFLSYISLVLWAVIGVSSILYLVTLLLMPVFAQLEADEEE